MKLISVTTNNNFNVTVVNFGVTETQFAGMFRTVANMPWITRRNLTHFYQTINTTF